MSAWTPAELDPIASSGELDISPVRCDGSLTRPVTIWSVRVGEELYVRSVRGDAGGWFKAAEPSHEGRVQAGATAVDVFFEDAPHHLDEEIDDAYKEKYDYPSGPVDRITSDAAKETTLRVVPR